MKDDLPPCRSSAAGEALQMEGTEMTKKVSNLREAAQQALKALEASIDIPAYGGHPQQERAAEALRAALAEPDTCTWQQDGDSDSGVYGTSCGSYFSIDDGTPADNKMQWCCFCGKKLGAGGEEI